jgi:hypothetical protein
LIDGWGRTNDVAEAHLDVLADSRTLDCPIAEPETIGTR